MTLDRNAAWILMAFPRELGDLGSPGLDDLATITGLRKKLATFVATVRMPTEGIGRVDDFRVPGPPGAPDVPVRVLWPADPAPGLPVVLHLHGGGFTIGSISQQEPVARRVTGRAGCVSVIAGYRLAPEHPFPAAPEDCYRVLEWLAGNAETLGVDPARIAVAGDSTGGTLAAALTLMARDRGGPPIAFQLLWYPATDGTGAYPSFAEPANRTRMLSATSASFCFRQYLGPDGADGERSPYAMPMRAESLAGLPPAFIATAGHDPLRDEGEDYARRLARAGVPTNLRRYPYLPHGFATIARSVPAAGHALDDTIDVLREALGLAAPAAPEQAGRQPGPPAGGEPAVEPSAGRRLQEVGRPGGGGAGAVLGHDEGDGEPGGQTQA